MTLYCQLGPQITGTGIIEGRKQTFTGDGGTRNTGRSKRTLTETVELGVLVPYPEDGRDAKDQRRPSVLKQEWKGLGAAYLHYK